MTGVLKTVGDYFELDKYSITQSRYQTEIAPTIKMN